MAVRRAQNLDSVNYKRSRAITHQVNITAYFLIGVCFAVFLILSALNDFLFFEWLAMGAFIVFTLIGMHFIGQKQMTRN